MCKGGWYRDTKQTHRPKRRSMIARFIRCEVKLKFASASIYHCMVSGYAGSNYEHHHTSQDSGQGKITEIDVFSHNMHAREGYL